MNKNRIGRLIKANSDNSINNDRAFVKTVLRLLEQLCGLYHLNDNQFPVNETSLIVNFISKQVYAKANSKHSKFFNKKTNMAKSKFHILYYACWLLSTLLSEESFSDFPSEDDNRIMGPIFTMLLNSIDIEFINDKGSSTLHSSEPIQAVYLNSSKKENVVLIGTFNNIFSTRKINSIEDLFAAYHESSSSPKKGVTMNKIVDMIEKNPQLQDLFGTKLFDDVKLEHALEDLRKKAYADLDKKKSVFMKFLTFHSANKVFDLNIYVGKYKIIVFDIGFKGKFLKASINQKIKMIKKSLPQMLEIENNIDYLQVFLRKYQNKNVYVIRGMSALSNMIKTLDEIQDYTASIEVNSEEDKELIVLLMTFAYFAEDVANLASIAHNSSLHNTN